MIIYSVIYLRFRPFLFFRGLLFYWRLFDVIAASTDLPRDSTSLAIPAGMLKGQDANIHIVQAKPL